MADWSAPVPETHRNWATWVLFFLAIFAAVASFLDAARYMGWIAVESVGDIDFFVEDAQWLGAIFAGLIGVVAVYLVIHRRSQRSTEPSAT